MKTRSYSNKLLPLLVGLLVTFSASPAFSDNTADMEVSNAGIITPENDSLSSRLLFRFDLPSKLDDKRIDYAQVVFTAKIDTLSRYSVIFAGYPITTAWDNASVSWSSPWANEGGDYVDSLYDIGFVKAGGEARFDITHLVARWQQGSMPNYGLIIIPVEEERKITQLVHPEGLPQGVYAKVTIYFSYTHP